MKQRVVDHRVAMDCSSISEIMQCSEIAFHLPDFITNVYHAQTRVIVNLQVSHDTFTKFLEFCYCDRVLTPLTGHDV